MAWRAQFRFSFAFPLGLESLSNGPPPLFRSVIRYEKYRNLIHLTFPGVKIKADSDDCILFYGWGGRGRRDVTGYMYMNITLFLVAALISYPLCGIHCGVDSTRSLASYSTNILLSCSLSPLEKKLELDTFHVKLYVLRINGVRKWVGWLASIDLGKTLPREVLSKRQILAEKKASKDWFRV